MITPDAVVGDIHPLLALASRFHQKAIHFDDGRSSGQGSYNLADTLEMCCPIG
jgi:hypothetical protein